MARASPGPFRLRSSGGASDLARLAPGEAITVGSDARNTVSIGHGSMAPFHARLRCDDWGVWVAPVPGAAVAVAGEPTLEERLVPLGARVELGTLTFELVSEHGAHDSRPVSAMRRFHEWLVHAASLLTSALLHLALLWLARHFVFAKVEDPRDLSLRSDPMTSPDAEWAEETPPEARLPEPPLEPAPEIEPLEEVPPPDPASRSVDSLAQDLDSLRGPLRVGVGAATGGESLVGSGRLSLDGDFGGAGGLVARLRALRGTGVDLVFVIDATSSMRPFLEAARTAADGLVNSLAVLVEDLRVGIVAFRDEGDEFTTRVLPLGSHRYAILNFLWGLRAEGGGDVPEALGDALEAAVRESGWRSDAHRVVVVVGDAPPHSGDWPRLKATIARFASSGPEASDTVVSAIYTGPPRERIIDPGEDGAAALAEIARLGHGDFLDLGRAEEVANRLLILTLGAEHADEIAVLLRRVQDGPREKVIQSRAKAGDLAWLLAMLRRPPIHPGIVDALLDSADRSVLWNARKLLSDEGAPRESREAALYLLRRCLPPAMDLSLDLDLAAQASLLSRLDAMILRR